MPQGEPFRGWLVAGLGNPGARYAGTRHNIGFDVLDALAGRLEAAAWSRRFRGLFSAARRDGLPDGVLLLKPLTYMNLSGTAVQGAMAFYRARPDRTLVVHDDMDLALGAVRLKVGGGTAGHRGLESIAAAVGPDFVRVRVGIGRPSEVGAVDHVLSRFASGDAEALGAVVPLAVDMTLAVLDRGAAAAMNEFHSRRARALSRSPARRSPTRRRRGPRGIGRHRR